MLNQALTLNLENDLKICKSKELESAFIEIINKNECNDIVGVIYRLPCMNENLSLIHI